VPKTLSFTLEKLTTVVIGKYVRQLPKGYAYLNSLADVTKKKLFKELGKNSFLITTDCNVVSLHVNES
jgi:hypothetical protein